MNLPPVSPTVGFLRDFYPDKFLVSGSLGAAWLPTTALAIGIEKL